MHLLDRKGRFLQPASAWERPSISHKPLSLQVSQEPLYNPKNQILPIPSFSQSMRFKS